MGPYADDALRRLTGAFEATRDTIRARAMSAYMRNLFPFMGIKGPQREALERDAIGAMPRPHQDDLREVASALWAMPEREYQYAACGLLIKHSRSLDAAFLPDIRGLLETKSWWDTVDTLAARVVGPIVLRDRELREEMDRWVRDPNFWVARAAILHQLKFKSATDTARLFDYCEQRSGDAEFFIRKAIGWALREYSKTDAASVRAFVAANNERLSGLSKREALLWLNGGRKARRVAAAD